MKRVFAWTLAVCVWLTVMTMPVAAAPIERSLLLPDATRLTSTNGSFSYTADGVLVLESLSEDGATVAIMYNQFTNIQTLRYLQLSLEATCPFNIALKISGEERNIHPQLAGPSWYEAFQESAPGDGEGVASGIHTMSQDIIYYAQYNDLSLPDDGYVTLKSVFITLKGAGRITLEHLKLSSEPDFVTMSNHVGALPPLVPMLPEYDLKFNKTDEERYAEGLASPGAVYGYDESDGIITMVWLAIGTVAVTAVAVVIVKKRVPKRLNMDVFEDDNEKK